MPTEATDKGESGAGTGELSGGQGWVSEEARAGTLVLYGNVFVSIALLYNE